jgi:hypothetical protein
VSTPEPPPDRRFTYTVEVVETRTRLVDVIVDLPPGAREHDSTVQYRTAESARAHVTRTPRTPWDETRVTARVSFWKAGSGRRRDDTIRGGAVCPMCGSRHPDEVDLGDRAICPHPFHYYGRNPERPYFLDLLFYLNPSPRPAEIAASLRAQVTLRVEGRPEARAWLDHLEDDIRAADAARMIDVARRWVRVVQVAP